MKKKGFTLVELLVVIAIIALLMSILMPALSKVRQIAYRIVCGSNLTGIGKSMLVYSQDNDEQYPTAGKVAKPTWSGTVAWTATTVNNPTTADYPAAGSTITSCFYLLVKYADVQPKQFICKGDEGSSPFSPSAETISGPKEITEYFDFGASNLADRPTLHCSYSYQLPFTFSGGTRYNISAASPGNSPLCSDRNPCIDKNADVYRDGAISGETAPYWNGTTNSYTDPARTGNAAAHQRDGQNVLFQDTHVEFARYPNVGINNDNIFKLWNCPVNTANPAPQLKELGLDTKNTATGRIVKVETDKATCTPRSKEDAFLCSEPN